jgi:YidC/Oxa1 family membrane protein insertase
MDSGRFLLAVILMIIVMVVTNILLPPPAPPAPDGAAADSAAIGSPQPDVGAAPAAPAATTDSAAADPVDTAAATVDPTAPPPPAGLAAAEAETTAVRADTVLVRSPLYEFRLSTAGAALVGARLLAFESQNPDTEGQPVELSSDAAPGLFSYRLRVGTREIDLNSLAFTPVPAGPVEVDEQGGPTTVELRHEEAGVDVAYTFTADRYLVDVRMTVTGTGAQTPTLLLGLPKTLAMNEAVPQEDERALGYVFNSEREGIGSERLRSVRAEQVDNGPLYWAAVKNKYFVTAALTHPESPSRFGGIIARPLPVENAADLTATLLPGPDGTFSFRLYLGPQEPARLAALGQNFGDVNPFGWRPFRPILRPLGHAIQWALFGMHDLLGVGYGWVLVLFGVIIRLVLWPLNAKAMRSQLKNMEIQPKLKDIQTRYKNEPEKLQKEMLRLYKEEGFNPMGGCLPMLIPLPILITLFFVFQSTIAFRGVEFLWLPDLSRADPLYILPVLLGLSMFLMQWLSGRSMTEMNPQMKFMMYAMPVFMTVIFLNFASGLNLYYASMNFASIPQQFQIMRERKRFREERGL